MTHQPGMAGNGQHSAHANTQQEGEAWVHACMGLALASTGTTRGLSEGMRTPQAAHFSSMTDRCVEPDTKQRPLLAQPYLRTGEEEGGASKGLRRP